MPTKRTTFLIDGFNLYHSAVQAGRDLNGATTKWLDIRSLCTSYLPSLGKEYALAGIYYYSALAMHLRATKPQTVSRHLAFIECLRANNIVVELARFKEKQIWCDRCRKFLLRHEEKETDVAMAVGFIELFANDACDTAVLVTGDTDIAPAVRAARRLYPMKEVCFLFPYKRKNGELKQLVSRSFKITKEAYLRHQFPDPVELPDGRTIPKPLSW
jgi:uncharacterized LabA/DUF88 family protein